MAAINVLSADIIFETGSNKKENHQKKHQQMGGLEQQWSTFFKGIFFRMYVSNRWWVGAIDIPGLFENVCDQYDIPKVSEKISSTTFR